MVCELASEEKKVGKGIHVLRMYQVYGGGQEEQYADEKRGGVGGFRTPANVFSLVAHISVQNRYYACPEIHK